MAKRLLSQRRELSDSGFVDNRNALAPLWLSLFPFLFIEYVTELLAAMVPSGIIFPMGYLLFWSFYYTYYRPGFLEDGLRDPFRWDLIGLAVFILGVFVWFVKVSVVQFGELILFGRKRQVAKARTRPQAAPRRESQPAYQAPKPQSRFPTEVALALRVLGLSENADWKQIHGAYRTLAKQYHPDLNPRDRLAAQKFIEVDRAFHRLESVRQVYF